MNEPLKNWRRELKSYDIPINCTLPQFIALLEALARELPAEHRDTIMVELLGHGGDECPYLELEWVRNA